MTDGDVLVLLDREISRAGSMRALARRRGVSVSYLSFVKSGRLAPGRKILDPLGLERFVMYRAKGGE